MDALLDILSWACLMTGAFLGITGAVGLFRLPDFFARMHAAGITDTLCTMLIILGLILQAGWSMTSMKLVLIVLFLTYTSPTAAHSLAKAALEGGLKPWLAGRGEPSSSS